MLPISASRYPNVLFFPIESAEGFQYSVRTGVCAQFKAMLEREGLAARDGTRLTITERGMPVLEAILRALVRGEEPALA